MPKKQQSIPDDDPDLAALLTTLDEFLRSRELPVGELLIEFFAVHGSTRPASDAYTLVDNLSFTAHRYRRQATESPQD
ncbi:hypothetical protein [Nocardia sp. NPDC051570]|uniref:hypothetical protein n=1 Tax=Nocardia sp. NPDC051570 TaxID=3364324 RepID=UPI0037AD82D2